MGKIEFDLFNYFFNRFGCGVKFSKSFEIATNQTIFYNHFSGFNGLTCEHLRKLICQNVAEKICS